MSSLLPPVKRLRMTELSVIDQESPRTTETLSANELNRFSRQNAALGI